MATLNPSIQEMLEGMQKLTTKNESRETSQVRGDRRERKPAIEAKSTIPFPHLNSKFVSSFLNNMPLTMEDIQNALRATEDHETVLQFPALDADRVRAQNPWKIATVDQFISYSREKPHDVWLMLRKVQTERDTFRQAALLCVQQQTTTSTQSKENTTGDRCTDEAHAKLLEDNDSLL